MQQKVPARFLKLFDLTEVPRSEYTNSPRCEDANDEQKRSTFFKLLRGAISRSTKTQDNFSQQLKFNVAAWLHIMNPAENSLSLVISYKDKKGAFGVIVEEAPASEFLMLAGEVDIDTTGPIEFIRVSCSGLLPEQQVTVDELHVKRIVDAKVSARKAG
ncbi:MAG: hypothetical protein MI864_03195 [Pseudomonadales bacterium]|nr:hypothetical protein [Pseudomonadales bacterium]